MANCAGPAPPTRPPRPWRTARNAWPKAPVWSRSASGPRPVKGRLANQLQAALEHRWLIEQAKGMSWAVRGWAQAAFERLRQAARIVQAPPADRSRQAEPIPPSHRSWSPGGGPGRGAPSPGGCRCAEGGTPDPCHRDHPARPGVKLERPQAASSPFGPSQLVGAGGRGRFRPRTIPAALFPPAIPDCPPGCFTAIFGPLGLARSWLSPPPSHPGVAVFLVFLSG
jgi:hypothetical protein